MCLHQHSKKLLQTTQNILRSRRARRCHERKRRMWCDGFRRRRNRPMRQNRRSLVRRCSAAGRDVGTTGTIRLNITIAPSHNEHRTKRPVVNGDSRLIQFRRLWLHHRRELHRCMQMVTATPGVGQRRAGEPRGFDGRSPHAAVRDSGRRREPAKRQACRRPHLRSGPIYSRADHRPDTSGSARDWIVRPRPSGADSVGWR